MLKCKEITHLVSEAQDRKLRLAERLELELHLAMCSGCKNFRQQMAFLREACSRYRSAEVDQKKAVGKDKQP